jgi:predicted GH43/DUF377 family glycosyl hydrolase
MSKQEYPLSKNLKKLREKKELSQDRLAKLADVANNTIIKIEQGENINPTLDPLFWFENRNVGGGCPPIETKDGWLIIYHAVEDTPFGKIYHASAALLDLKNPLKVLGAIKRTSVFPKGFLGKKWCYK